MTQTQRAEQAFDRGDYTTAVSLWREAIAMAPPTHTDVANLARAERLAIATERRAVLQKWPNSPIAALALAQSLYEANLTNDALQVIQSHRSTFDGGDAIRCAHLELVLLTQCGRVDDASATLRNLRTVTSDSERTLVATVGYWFGEIMWRPHRVGIECLVGVLSSASEIFQSSVLDALRRAYVDTGKAWLAAHARPTESG